MADQNRTAGARLQTSPSLEPVVSSVDFERATQQQQPMQHLNRGMILDRLAQLSKENSTQLTPLKAEPGTQLAGTPFCQSNSVAPQPICIPKTTSLSVYRPVAGNELLPSGDLNVVIRKLFSATKINHRLHGVYRFW